MNFTQDDEKYWPALAEALADSPSSEFVQARIVTKNGKTLRATSFRHIPGQLNVSRALNVIWDTYSVADPDSEIVSKGFSFLKLLCAIYELASIPIEGIDALVLYYFKRNGAVVYPVSEEAVLMEIIKQKKDESQAFDSTVKSILDNLPQDKAQALQVLHKCVTNFEKLQLIQIEDGKVLIKEKILPSAFSGWGV